MGDITYIWTWSGFAYLATDLSRRSSGDLEAVVSALNGRPRKTLHWRTPFATIKRELISTRAWRRVVELRRAVFNYIEGWYNTRRLHSSLGYLSPARWEALHRDTLAPAA